MQSSTLFSLLDRAEGHTLFRDFQVHLEEPHCEFDCDDGSYIALPELPSSASGARAPAVAAHILLHEVSI